MSKVIHKITKINYIIYSTLPVLLLVLVLFGSTSSASAEKVTYNVRIEPTLNIAVSTERVTLLLNPSSSPFNTGDLDITVSTNNPNGYKLYVNANDTRLTNNTYAEPAYINTLSSSATQATFPTNSWGYQISAGNTGDSTITSTTDFHPFASGALISSSSAPTTDDETTLTFAAKAGYDKPSGSYTLDLTFKALPIITTYTMQNLDPEVCTTDPTIVTDIRDGQSYAIARLEDGKCWMLQNLKLGKTTDSLTLTADDSNVNSTGYVLDGKSADGIMTTETVIVDGASVINQNNNSQYACLDDYGCFYNWYTATASSGTTWTTGDANYDICPKGWVLPTGGDNGEFATLAISYGYSSDASAESKAEVATRMLVANPTVTSENVNGVYKPGLLLDGGTGTTGIGEVGVAGAYWTRSNWPYNYGRYAHYVYIKTSSVYPTAYVDKYMGRSVRCLLTEPSN